MHLLIFLILCTQNHCVQKYLSSSIHIVPIIYIRERPRNSLICGRTFRSVRAATALCVFLQYISSVQFWCSAGTLDNNSATLRLFYYYSEEAKTKLSISTIGCCVVTILGNGLISLLLVSNGKTDSTFVSSG